MPSNVRNIVVLPAPFGPKTPKMLPNGTFRFTPSTARNPSNCLTSPCASIAYILKRAPDEIEVLNRVGV
jgi:hypothetical protein